MVVLVLAAIVAAAMMAIQAIIAGDLNRDPMAVMVEAAVVVGIDDTAMYVLLQRMMQKCEDQCPWVAVVYEEEHRSDTWVVVVVVTMAILRNSSINDNCSNNNSNKLIPLDPVHPRKSVIAAVPWAVAALVATATTPFPVLVAQAW
jgi:hypothetical protein